MRILFLSLFLVSCTTVKPNPDHWGKFEGSVKTEWVGPRDMKLLEDIKYIGPDRVWVAEKDSIINGASIPKIFWSTIGGPFEGEYRVSSVFHDVECDKKRHKSADVHYMFYTAMRASGVSERRSKVMYAAVYRFGPRWTVSTSTKLCAGREPNNTDVQKIETFVQRENPTIDELKSSQEIPGRPQ